MKTDKVEQKIQPHYKRYIKSVESIIKKAEEMTGETYTIDNVSSRTRNENISKALKTMREYDQYDEDLVIFNNEFEKILSIVEKCRVYDNNNLAKVKGRGNINQHGRIGVFRALNKYNPNYDMRLITFIKRNVFYEFEHQRPSRFRNCFVSTGMSDRDIKKYWAMQKLFDEECDGDIKIFNAEYQKNEKLQQFKKRRTDDFDGFCWIDFFAMERTAVWNVYDIDEYLKDNF